MKTYFIQVSCNEKDGCYGKCCSDLCLHWLSLRGKETTKGCARAQWWGFKCLLPEVLKHSVFSFIWFFKMLAECSPLLLLFPHMDNICLLFTQPAAMCALPKTLILFVYI